MGKKIKIERKFSQKGCFFEKHVLKSYCYATKGIIIQNSPLRCSARMFVCKEEPIMDQLKAFVSEQLKTEVPVFNIGDTVRVHNRIKEGTRERVQMFEGIVIAKHGGGISETFTVRRISYGVGVEKTFPLHSPNVEKVDVIRQGVVRRAKLFYLRDKVGKNAKVKEKITK